MVIFGETTGLEIIMSIMLDVVAKGGDDNPDTIVGAKGLFSIGGEGKIVPSVERFSTTKLIANGEDKEAIPPSIAAGAAHTH